MRRILTAVILLLGTLAVQGEDYKTTPEYLALRDSMQHGFNSGDSARFYPALQNLEDYLLEQGDLHAYYTQRCNEVVFLMNNQRIFEAYKLARQLSKELQERKLDKEMYMAYNMLGHLNRYCGNKETAKDLFKKVIKMMEKAGYYESIPPIYVNIVNVEIDDDPEEARQLLDSALAIARKYSPERVFDIESRRTLSYFNAGDMDHFREGYKKYREGVAQGKSSVHGRSMEIYYEALEGNTDKAVEMARELLSDDGTEAVTMIYERAGRWQEAYQSLKRQTEASDSVNNVILSNTMQGFRDELSLYDIERKTAKARTITMAIIIVLLLLLIAALGYIMFSHRRNMRLLKRAYERALESDKIKSAFLQNMSHEVRTPLNIIGGFAQVLANPELTPDASGRKAMAETIIKNTNIITSQIDEMLELAKGEAAGEVRKDDTVAVNELLSLLAASYREQTSPGVVLNVASQLDDSFTYVTHRDLLKRAIAVLLDNAVKNTTKGSITVRAEASDSLLTLTVEDTGVGIPAEDAERIFERFFKLDTFKTGLGLGLTLCRNIITRLGGNIHLDTTYCIGARFVINLPISEN